MPKGKSSGDYEGWILRMLEKGEDIFESFFEEDWEEFVHNVLAPKVEDYHGYPITGAQYDALLDARRIVRDEVTDRLGVDVEEQVRYRSVKTGHFVKQTPEGFFNKKGEPVVVREEKRLVYRVTGDIERIRGTFISKDTITGEIAEQKEAKGWRPKKKHEGE